jgi:choline dehydrogenase
VATNPATRTPDADYIVIGSGAGGGPLAANLARAGYSVLLLEAGGDPCAASELGRWMYEVPIFHGLSTEYPECQWDYFVRHYTSPDLQRQDTKFVDKEKLTGYPVDGVWYPRAGTLGGCTAHNAMITVTPQDRDWNAIAEFTGDESWRADRMHQYYARLENCQYRPRPGSLRYLLAGLAWSVIARIKGLKDGSDWTHGHGFDGWLTTSASDPRLVLTDKSLTRLLLGSLKDALGARLGNPALTFLTQLDPNDLRNAYDSKEGLAVTPLAVANGKRNGPREFLLRTRKTHPKLTIQMHALAKKLLFDGTRAVGVEYYDGPHVYEADPAVRARGGPAAGDGTPVRRVFAGKEVIVSAGAFNSPQLLKLSGIGPKAELQKWGIDVVVDLPGVGENLQDRYEVGVVSRMRAEFSLLRGLTFRPPRPGDAPDPGYVDWLNKRGVYTTNGALLGIVRRSRPELVSPDLFLFGLPARFTGYYPGYSQDLGQSTDVFTWAVLKAHTVNRAGSVLLRSADPCDPPDIRFRYFDEGDDRAGEDLDAVVTGIQLARSVMRRLGGDVSRELLPGDDVRTRDELRTFVRDQAWGHHASCTAAMGRAGDPRAVVDSDFRVHGTRGLRVVDASVFPRIPGFFIVTAVYMVAEKASAALLADATGPPPARVGPRRVLSLRLPRPRRPHVSHASQETR